MILMDIRMPDIDGIETTSRLLRDNPTAHILIMTVIEDPSVHVNAMLAGARGSWSMATSPPIPLPKRSEM